MRYVLFINSPSSTPENMTFVLICLLNVTLLNGIIDPKIYPRPGAVSKKVM